MAGRALAIGLVKTAFDTAENIRHVIESLLGRHMA
jgi:hypothetical protein